MKLLNFLKNEVSGWTPFEICWLAGCVAANIILSLVMGDTVLGTFCCACATLYTVIAGKGKISCYFFGIVNTIGYGAISFGQTLYGEVMLNWGWYLPMMFVGIFFWKRNLNKEQEIRKTCLNTVGRAVTVLASLAGIAAYALILKSMKDQSPWLDSTTTVLSVTAMILTVKRCMEQWILWTVVNAISVWMWLDIYLKSGDGAACLMMWIIALANGILFYYTWRKEMKSCKA